MTIDFGDVRPGDTLAFLTADNGFAGSGHPIERTGTVVAVTEKTVVVSTSSMSGPGPATARLRRADWYHRHVRKVEP